MNSADFLWRCAMQQPLPGSIEELASQGSSDSVEIGQSRIPVAILARGDRASGFELASELFAASRQLSNPSGHSRSRRWIVPFRRSTR